MQPAPATTAAGTADLKQLEGQPGEHVRDQFPIFARHPDLVYLDSAAMTQKPKAVTDAERDFSEQSLASVHRATYALAEAATQVYEETREQVRTFFNVPATHECIFTSGATAALNLAVWMITSTLSTRDEILVSVASHHSVIVPLQRAARLSGARLKWFGTAPRGGFDAAAFRQTLSARTKLVALPHIANATGAVSPLQAVVAAAHDVGARVIIDAAQTTGHVPLDLHRVPADFAAFSAHKAYGPTGVGWLIAARALLDQAEPLLQGGGAVEHVSRRGVAWRQGPHKFEAGTPNITGVAGLSAALAFLAKLGRERIRAHEQHLIKHTREALAQIPGCTTYAPANRRDQAAIVAFTLRGTHGFIHTHDITHVLNEWGVAVRGGHHCAQPLLEFLRVPELVRISFGVYTTSADIDRLLAGIEAVQQLFKPARVGQ